MIFLCVFCLCSCSWHFVYVSFFFSTLYSFNGLHPVFVYNSIFFCLCQCLFLLFIHSMVLICVCLCFSVCAYFCFFFSSIQWFQVCGCLWLYLFLFVYMSFSSFNPFNGFHCDMGVIVWETHIAREACLNILSSKNALQYNVSQNIYMLPYASFG